MTLPLKERAEALGPEPLPIKLKAVMLRYGIQQGDLADRLPQTTPYKGRTTLSRSSVAQMLNHGWRPAKTDWSVIVAATEAYLLERGVPPETVAEIWQEDTLVHHSTKPLNRRVGEDRSGRTDTTHDSIDIGTEMLSAQAKRHFSLFRDPFVDDVQGPDDLFLSADQRYVREAMYQAARAGGWFIAVVGESGSGKSTLRRETIDRIARESLPVVVIQPKSFDKTALKAAHICHAILADVKPNEHPKRSLEALARQVEKALTDSSRSGQTHVLMIEEAHDLSIQTLKYLKRFWEMEDGFKKLLSIVLIGQPELKSKLNEKQHMEAREVIRRCEVVELLPLDNQLPDYIALKFKRIGATSTELFDPSAFDAMVARLTLVGRGPQRNQTVSLNYPLVVNNLVTQALNHAADIGAPRVTADIVKGC